MNSTDTRIPSLALTALRDDYEHGVREAVSRAVGIERR